MEALRDDIAELNRELSYGKRDEMPKERNFLEGVSFSFLEELFKNVRKKNS